MDKKLIIFDCDGTLVDSEVIAARIFTKYWSSHGVHFTEEEFKEKFIGTGKDAAIVQETFARLPKNAQEEGDKIFDLALATELEAVPQIESLLEELGHYDICVGSNSSMAYVERALRKTNLLKFFGRNFFSSDLVERPKPAPDLFLHCAEIFNKDPQNCLVVEDSPSGLRAAKNAGMKSIAFTGARHFTPTLKKKLLNEHHDWHCDSVRELKLTL